MRRGFADERVDIGIAAHDAVHDDDVVRLDSAVDEVPDPPLDATFEPRSAISSAAASS